MTEKRVNELVTLFDSRLRQIMEIWSEQFTDTEFGGYLTCRNRDFSLYATDKGAWGQARQIFTYSMMAEYDTANRERWLALAKIGIDFVLGKMMNNLRVNYLTDRQGNVLEGSTSIFSDAFMLLGLSKYMAVSEDKAKLPLLDQLYAEYEKNIMDPSFSDIAPCEYNPGVIHHAIYMISVNVATELISTLGKDRTEPLLSHSLSIVLNVLKDNQYGCILEKKRRDGSRLASPDALFMNTGHVFESMWFAIDAIKSLARDELLPQVCDICENAYGYGTVDDLIIFSSMLGSGKAEYRTWKYEIAFNHTDRVSWAYAESMVLFLYLYRMTGEQKWYQRFEMHLQYVEQHFIDNQFGDWFHALAFDGTVISDMKGSTVKDAYHIPRAYAKMLSILEEIR